MMHSLPAYLSLGRWGHSSFGLLIFSNPFTKPPSTLTHPTTGRWRLRYLELGLSSNHRPIVSDASPPSVPNGTDTQPARKEVWALRDEARGTRLEGLTL